MYFRRYIYDLTLIMSFIYLQTTITDETIIGDPIRIKVDTVTMFNGYQGREYNYNFQKLNL